MSDPAQRFEPPNYTQVPNEYFDEILPQIETMAEMKVTEVIIRQTFGWHKDEDQISLQQLEQLTGMQRQQVVAGCKKAIQRGYVWQEKRSGRNYFGLQMGGYENHTSRGMKIIPTKERVKERVSKSNDLDAQGAFVSGVEPLESFTMRAIYTAMKDAGFVITKEDYSKQIKRVQWMLENMVPLDHELDALPEAYVKSYKIRGPACDAVYALNELRRAAAREEVIAAGKEEQGSPGKSYYEKRYPKEEAKPDPVWEKGRNDLADYIATLREKGEL